MKKYLTATNLFGFMIFIILGYLFIKFITKTPESGYNSDLLLLGDKENGFKKMLKNTNETNMINCPSGCTLVSASTAGGAANTVTVGNNTYTCRCSDGSTTSPILS